MEIRLLDFGQPGNVGDGTSLDRWTSYSFTSDFLTPTDSFHFTIGDPEYVKGVSGAVREGLRVSLRVNGNPICTGVIDEVAMGADRSGGTTFECNGRDILGDAVDGTVSPYVKFTPQDTLAKVIETVLGPYGIRTIAEDNNANRSLRVGNQFGTPKNKPRQDAPAKKKRSFVKRKSKAGQTTSKFLSYESKPYPSEGAYEFCHRLAKRAGLHIWAKADGSGVVVGKPDYTQEPTFRLVRRVSGVRGPNRGEENNILSGYVKRSRVNQPSVIIAGGKSGGGDFARATMRVLMVNELVSVAANGNLTEGVRDFLKEWAADETLPETANYEAYLKRSKKAYVITKEDFEGEGAIPKSLTPYPVARPLFLLDQESNNLEQLINFTKREMAARQMQALEVHYEVAGHTQDGKVWSTDTMVTVEDDVANLYETLWVKTVTFSKSRSGGTRTSLTLIRPNTLRL